MRQEWVAIFVSAAVLFVAAGGWLVLKRMAAEVDGASFIAMLFVPLVLYALISGRIQEFSGPGGWNAKFRDVVASPVHSTAIDQNAANLAVVERGVAVFEKGGGGAELQALIARVDPKKPNALLLHVGFGGYVREVVIQYLQALKASGPATYVIFDYANSGTFIGSASADQILAILQSDLTADGFMQELSSPRAEPLVLYPVIVRDHLDKGDTTQSALEKFQRSGASALVVIDDRKAVAIVDRAQLLTTLLSELAQGPAS